MIARIWRGNTRADKADNGCGVCHGYPFEGRIIEKAWGIAAK